ncbi:hypothetical protein [Desulfoscipio gibsoniae]|nr:hypothetical protein [Desulfoscipio gibsoniae]
MAQTDNKKTGLAEPGQFYKPYRIKPAEVYVEPNPNVCDPKEKSTK